MKFQFTNFVANLILMFLTTSSLANESKSRYPAVQLDHSYLKNYLSDKPQNDLDIHGIDSDSNTVILRPDSSFMTYIKANNIQHITRFDLNRRTDITNYMQADEVVSRIRQLAADNPTITKFFEIGTTHQGRPIVGVEITSEFEIDKPVISFNGMHHARELMTTEVTFSIAEKLVAGFNSNDQEIREFLNQFKIVVIPQVNPDGNYIVHEGDIFWRKNGRQNTSGRVFGVDLNRNYPVDWNFCNGSSGRVSSQTYRGEKAASEPETKAMLKFFETYRPIANISYHAYSELIIFPYGCTKSKNTASDLFLKIAKEMNDVITNDKGETGKYRLGTAPKLLYQADGTDLDTHWRLFGTLSYTIELNSAMQGFHPAYDLWRDKTVANQEQGWKQLIRSSMKSGIKFRTNRNLNYVIKTSDGQSFAGLSGPKTFSSLKDKINYRVLDNGKYSLELIHNSKIVDTIFFEVKDKIIDLGLLDENT